MKNVILKKWINGSKKVDFRRSIFEDRKLKKAKVIKKIGHTTFLLFSNSSQNGRSHAVRP
jgi:hypothetical protein